MKEGVYWLGFSLFPGIGPATFKRLLIHFITAKNAWNADYEELKKAGVSEKISRQFVEFKKKFSFEKQLDLLQKKNIMFVTWDDSLYPNRLKQIKNPPFVLYVKGSLDLLSKEPLYIGIVGARKVTNYGREVTEQFTRYLSHAQFTVVSGLAYGVDTIAHKTTLESGGNTIAVLGCGVDCCTPQENQNLYNEIIEKGGSIVSELPLSHPPTAGSFPARNRIIAGLSDSVLVTEGTEDSGALITAEYAFDTGKTVYAVPGPINSLLSKGPYKLLKKGAILVTSPHEILENMQLPIYSFTEKQKISGDSKEEELILTALQREELTIDELVRITQISASQINILVSLMELKGYLINKSGKFKISN